MDSEEFEIEQFKAFFESKHIELLSVWICDSRVLFLELMYTIDGTHLFVYIQSKFTFRSTGSTPKNRLSAGEEPFFPSDSASSQVKSFLEKSIPCLKTQFVKLMYLAKRHILMVNRHNELEPFETELPQLSEGYYYVTDWENFFDHVSDIPSTCSRLDNALVQYFFEREEVRMVNPSAVEQLHSKLKKWSSSRAMQESIERIRKVDLIVSKHPKKEAIALKDSVRKKTLSRLSVVSVLGDLCSQVSLVAPQL
jgi:hypothetical protein